jgi:hypothetical protein
MFARTALRDAKMKDNDVKGAASNDAVHRFYQGVLYRQNATQFYGTRMKTISFYPVTRVRHTGYSMLCRLGYGISHESSNYGRKLIYASKVWILLRQSTQNSVIQ